MNPISRFLSFIFISLIKLYKITLSQWIGRSCRFHPTCSTYTINAIKNLGPFKGIALGFWRILRCSPWGGYGYDPAPEKFIFKNYKSFNNYEE